MGSAVSRLAAALGPGKASASREREVRGELEERGGPGGVNVSIFNNHQRHYQHHLRFH